jgi:hypothetical protein
VWAAASGGMIRGGRGGRELVRVGEASAAGERWARVKSAGRAIEKCVRCYGQVPRKTCKETIYIYIYTYTYIYIYIYIVYIIRIILYKAQHPDHRGRLVPIRRTRPCPRDTPLSA